MKKILRQSLSFFIIFPIIVFILISGFIVGLFFSNRGSEILQRTKVLGDVVERFSETNPSPTVFNPSPSIIPPSPTPIEYKVNLIDSPTEITEGGQATFTWTVDGPPVVIHKSTVYFGTAGNKGILTRDTVPADTKYSDSVKDFLQGDYSIPMTFVGNVVIPTAGKYYFRAYALAGSSNFWSEEKVLTVKSKPVPGYEIKLVNYPQKVKLNDNSAFTWEITGPSTTTGFTAIVGEKTSKSGRLDETTDLSKTPYRILVKDFTSGSFNVPLVYIGNTVMPEYGIYYIRALAVINGKNIWSDEHTVSVE